MMNSQSFGEAPALIGQNTQANMFDFNNPIIQSNFSELRKLKQYNSAFMSRELEPWQLPETEYWFRKLTQWPLEEDLIPTSDKEPPRNMESPVMHPQQIPNSATSLPMGTPLGTPPIHSHQITTTPPGITYPVQVYLPIYTNVTNFAQPTPIYSSPNSKVPIGLFIPENCIGPIYNSPYAIMPTLIPAIRMVSMVPLNNPAYRSRPAYVHQIYHPRGMTMPINRDQYNI